MLASLLYMVLRRLLTVVAPKHRSDDAAQIEIFVLRHQLQVLRRQVKRPVYRHGDRALLAAAAGSFPKSAGVRLLVAGWRAALPPRFCRLLVDFDEDPAARALVVGMLGEMERRD